MPQCDKTLIHLQPSLGLLENHPINYRQLNLHTYIKRRHFYCPSLFIFHCGSFISLPGKIFMCTFYPLYIRFYFGLMKISKIFVIYHRICELRLLICFGFIIEFTLVKGQLYFGQFIYCEK